MTDSTPRLYIHSMFTVTLSGRVNPGVWPITLPDLPEVKWPLEYDNVIATFNVHIHHAQLKVTCSMEIYEDKYFTDIYRKSLDLARACIDTFAFASGAGLSVSLDKVSFDGSAPQTITFSSPPELYRECTVIPFSELGVLQYADYIAILHIVISEPAIFILLNHLIACISMHHVVPANCGRVIDGLRKLVDPSKPEIAWLTFREALNLDISYLALIAENSKGPRHGEQVRIEGSIVGEIQKRTWAVMNRFLEYKKRSSQKLPIVEFPLLYG